ncbi:sugar-binding protein [Planctomycetota bacterium]
MMTIQSLHMIYHRFKKAIRPLLCPVLRPVLLSLCLGVVARGGVLDQARQEGETLNQGLIVTEIGRYGRQPLYTDMLVHALTQGTWTPPTEGQSLQAADGEEQIWQPIRADAEGWFSAQGTGGYLYLPYTATEPGIMLVNVLGPSMFYANGEPRVGSRYAYTEKPPGWEPDFNMTFLPVKVQKGSNEFLLRRTWRSRGRAKLILLDPPTSLLFNTRDTTLPNLIVGHPTDTQGAIVVINATEQAQTNLRIRVNASQGPPVETPIPRIEALSTRKVAFTLRHAPVEEKGWLALELSLIDGRDKTTIYDTHTLNLAVKHPHETRKITFLSDIDGSVQHYALNPARPLPGDKSQPGLVMSTHGARAKAIGQAQSYAHKPWCHIVSPTNRRAYGFDWEDWGRLDFWEAMGQVRESLDFDPTRVYLTGHSMGGHGTWILGSQFPDRFAAIGPSAGWISFQSYRRAPQPEDTDPVATLMNRAGYHSDTLALSRNLTDTGIYILHGGADRVVRPDQSEMMTAELASFHQDWRYHEEPNQGHWWDLSPKPGVDCVDWAPMFDFFARRVRPRANQVQQVDFKTANPGISAWSHWAGIISQHRPLDWSEIHLTYDQGLATFRGTTKNVRTLSLKLDAVDPDKTVTVELDGQVVDKIPMPLGKQIWLSQSAGQWRHCPPPSPTEKGPHRYGPFKDAWRHRMVFVAGTAGTPAENAWARAKARFDSETWWYQGNGAVDIIADTEFDPQAFADRGVILYGNADTNRAWQVLLSDSPIQVSREAVSVGGKVLRSDDLACLFLRPRSDSDVACVAVVSGTGLAGLSLTDRFGYFLAGCSYPDWIICNSRMLKHGHDGVQAAGIFGPDWSLETGEAAWRDAATSAAPKEKEKLPATIAADPRGFVAPKGYVCQRTTGPIVVDGKLDELDWQQATATEAFVDIEGDMRPVTPRHETRARMLWDDEYLYVAAHLEEPHVWGTITERNAVIFHDNDFEVFIDPDGDSHTYYEFEINALGTIWNLFLDRPYKHGDNAKIREMPGQQSRVAIAGSLNDANDIDEAWTVEIAFPWAAMAEHAGCACPPQDGQSWRINFSRVQWRHEVQEGRYVRIPARGQETDGNREDNWVWSPQGVINMHRPETWGTVQFSTQPVGSPDSFVPDPTARPRYRLSRVLYAQEAYHKEYGQYAESLKVLGLDKVDNISMTGKGQSYRASLRDKDFTLYLQNDGRIWRESKQ